MKKCIEKISFGYSVLLLFYLFIACFLYCYRIIDSTILSFGLIIFGITGFVIYLFSKADGLFFKTHEIFIIMLVIFSFLSFAFAYYPLVALLGFKSGREGLLVILTYYVIFLIGFTIKNDNYKKYFIYLVSFCGCIQFLYALLQAYSVSSLFGISIVGEYGYPSALFSNSNFYGSFSVLFAGLWLGRYFFTDTNRVKILSLLITEISLASVYLSGAMSAIVACLVMFLLVFFFSFSNYKEIKKMFVVKICLLIFSFLLLYVFFSMTSKVSITTDVVEVVSEASTAFNDGIKDSFGSGRIHIWKEAFSYFHKYKYYLTGIGIDNFFYLGHGILIKDYNTGYFIYKAHNEYLQILFCEGIFKLITYLLFLFFIFIKSLLFIFSKEKKSWIFWSLFIASVGYSVQAFFNISMTRVAPFYFLVLGMLLSFSDSFKKTIDLVGKE